MPGKHSLTTVEPVDNTRVVIGPSRSPATQADSKKLNDANNRAIAANVEALYSVLRFINETMEKIILWIFQIMEL